MKGHHIITSPGHPWGWDATLQDYDGDNLIGRGKTELIAVMELLAVLRDIEEEAERDKFAEGMRAEYEAMNGAPLRELDSRSSEYAERMCEQADMERKRIREEG